MVLATNSDAAVLNTVGRVSVVLAGLVDVVHTEHVIRRELVIKDHVVVLQVRRQLVLRDLDKRKADLFKFTVWDVQSSLQATLGVSEALGALDHKAEWHTVNARHILCEMTDLDNLFVLGQVELLRPNLLGKQLHAVRQIVNALVHRELALLLPHRRGLKDAHLLGARRAHRDQLCELLNQVVHIRRLGHEEQMRLDFLSVERTHPKDPKRTL